MTKSVDEDCCFVRGVGVERCICSFSVVVTAVVTRYYWVFTVLVLFLSLSLPLLLLLVLPLLLLVLLLLLSLLLR